MKFLTTISMLTCLAIGTQAQSDPLPDPEPYFTAVIVNDIDLSISWYNQHFGLEVVSKMDNEELGFSQANLRRGNVLIELLEIASAIDPQKIVPNFNSKTKLLGIFKFGFMVSDFDKWMNYLDEKGIEQYGSVVMDPVSNKKMIIVLDPDGNYVQIFEK